MTAEAYPSAWDGRDWDPTDSEVVAWRRRADALWARMTDAEREEVGAPRVECAVCKRDCGRGYSKTQAADCASAIKRGSDGRLYLTCHYGSELDGDAYEVVPTVTTSTQMPFAEADPVCDVCVRGYVAAGVAVLVGDFLHDEAVAERVFS